MEITKPLSYTFEQEFVLDNHSLINLLNVLQYNFLQISDIADEKSVLLSLSGKVQEMAQHLSNKSFDAQKLDEMEDLRLSIRGGVEEILARSEDLPHVEKLKLIAANIANITDIFRIRIEELRQRGKIGDFAGKKYHPNDLVADIRAFCNAVEKNSAGRYRIVENIALKDEKSYFIDLKVDSENGTEIDFPMVLKDVFRDLLANARKYTPAGGNILAGIYQDEEEISIVVEDNGKGIPEDEIEAVVDFGVRGRNVKDKKTFGGGFGLSKAYYVVKHLGGRMWIDSEEDKYTRICIKVPNHQK